jgi:hypothetical protein
MAVAPAAPFIPPFSGSIDLRLSIMAQAISRKADSTTQPVYSAVTLLAPNGTAWQLTVDNTGALSTTVVPR